MLLASLMASTTDPEVVEIPQLKVHLNRISTTNLAEIKTFRSGVIPYVIENDEVYFAMGVDTKTGDLTDFAGGVKLRDNEDALSGGLREFNQESLGVFGSFDCDNPDVIAATVVYTEGGKPRFKKVSFWKHDTMIIFLKVNVDMKEIQAAFNHKKEYIDELEVCDIVWLSFDDLIKLIRNKLPGHKMYDLVRRILIELYNSGDIKNLIPKMYREKN